MDTLLETNSWPLKMDGWNTTFLLGRPIFRGHVSFREGNLSLTKGWLRYPITAMMLAIKWASIQQQTFEMALDLDNPVRIFQLLTPIVGFMMYFSHLADWSNTL